MLRGKINAEAPVCEIRLALPWPVTAYIAEHGEEIVRIIQEAIGWRDTVVARRERDAERERVRLDAQRWRWHQLARAAVRQLRAHRATAPEARARVLDALARLAGDVGAPALDLLATWRVRSLRKKIRARRDRLIARLYLAGRTNAEIQSELRRFRYSGTSVGHISAILSRLRGESARAVARRSIGDASPAAIAGAERRVAGAVAGLVDGLPRDPGDASLRDPGDASPETSPPARPTRHPSSEPSPGSQRRPRARGNAR